MRSLSILRYFYRCMLGCAIAFFIASLSCYAQQKTDDASNADLEKQVLLSETDIDLLYYKGLPHFDKQPQNHHIVVSTQTQNKHLKYSLKQRNENHLLTTYYYDKGNKPKHKMIMEWTDVVPSSNSSELNGSNFAIPTMSINQNTSSQQTPNNFAHLLIQGDLYPQKNNPSPMQTDLPPIRLPKVKANVTEATCYSFGDIHLYISPIYGNSNFTIEWQGPISQANIALSGNRAHLSEISGQLLPAGIYTILISEVSPQPTLKTAIQVEIPLILPPNKKDCRDYLQTAMTAYWATTVTHNFFRAATPIYNNPNKPDEMVVIDLVSSLPNSHKTLCNEFSRNPNADLHIGILPDAFAGETHLIKPTIPSRIEIKLGELPKPMVSLDIVGHEYAHAINFNSIRLYSPDTWQGEVLESAVLLEGFCDILGILTEATVKPIDWVIGDLQHPSHSDLIRHADKPKLTGHPSTYKGQYWCQDPYCGNSFDDAHHFNSTVLSFWFYLLSEGGIGTVDDCNAANSSCKSYDIQGLGVSDASRVAYYLFTKALSSDADFKEICIKSLQVVDQLFPPDPDSLENYTCHYIETWKAWEAVGVVHTPNPIPNL